MEFNVNSKFVPPFMVMSVQQSMGASASEGLGHATHSRAWHHVGAADTGHPLGVAVVNFGCGGRKVTVDFVFL